MSDQIQKEKERAADMAEMRDRGKRIARDLISELKLGHISRIDRAVATQRASLILTAQGRDNAVLYKGLIDAVLAECREFVRRDPSLANKVSVGQDSGGAAGGAVDPATGTP